MSSSPPSLLHQQPQVHAPTSPLARGVSMAQPISGSKKQTGGGGGGSPRRSGGNNGYNASPRFDSAEQQIALGGNNFSNGGRFSAFNSSGNGHSAYGGFSTSPTNSGAKTGLNNGWGDMGRSGGHRNLPRPDNYAAFFSSGHPMSLSTSALPAPVSRNTGTTSNGWGNNHNDPVHNVSTHHGRHRSSSATLSSPPSPLLFQRDALTDPFMNGNGDSVPMGSTNGGGTGMYNAFSTGFVSPIGSPRGTSPISFVGNKSPTRAQSPLLNGGAPLSPSSGRRYTLPYSTSPILQQQTLLQSEASGASSPELGGPLTLNTLSTNFLIRIFSYLSPRDLVGLQLLSTTTKRLGDLAGDDRLWKDLYLKRWRLLETDAVGSLSKPSREKTASPTFSSVTSKSQPQPQDDDEDDSGDEWAWICSLLQQNNRWKDIYRTRYSADRWRVGTLKMFNGCWGFISQTPDPYSYTPNSTATGATNTSNAIAPGSPRVGGGSGPGAATGAMPSGAPGEETPLDIFFHRKDIAADGDWYEDWWLKDTPGVSRSQKCGYWDTFLCGRVVRYKQRAAYAQGRRPQACCISFVGDERRERLGTTPSAAVAAAVAAAASGAGLAGIIPGVVDTDSHHGNNNHHSRDQHHPREHARERGSGRDRRGPGSAGGPGLSAAATNFVPHGGGSPHTGRHRGGGYHH